MSFASPFKSSPQGQAISQAVAPAFAPMQQAFKQFQDNPVGQKLQQVFAPIADAYKQAFSPLSQWQSQIANGASSATQDWQSPVFNRMNFGMPTVQQQATSQVRPGLTAPWWGQQ